MISMKRLAMIVAAAAVVGCDSADSGTAYARSAASDTSQATPVNGTSAASKAALRFVLAPAGNVARYRVREQLMGRDLPNDAVGETKALSGAIALDDAGKVVREQSRLTLDAGSFVSDQQRRDRYVRGRLLEADNYPTITFVPTEIRGVSLPLPTSGAAPIEIRGDLTLRGVTRPTLWTGTVQFNKAGLSGSASTSFTFADIQLEQPRVPVLLSVADTIKLEIDFNLLRQ